MTIFADNRLTISLKRFIQLEIPTCRLVYYGNNKYYGNCQLLKHREVAGEGQSFLMDEQKGRASCVGKCGFQGADINQIGAFLWGCTNRKAAKRIQRNAKKYGPPRIRNKAKQKKHQATWAWSEHLEPFPKPEIAPLARQRGIFLTGDQTGNQAWTALVVASQMQQYQQPTPGRCLGDHGSSSATGHAQALGRLSLVWWREVEASTGSSETNKYRTRLSESDGIREWRFSSVPISLAGARYRAVLDRRPPNHSARPTDRRPCHHSYWSSTPDLSVDARRIYKFNAT